MKPEDLAIAVLRSLNALDDISRRGGFRKPESFGMGNYCRQQAQDYNDLPREECSMAIACAFQHLINLGMLVPDPNSNPFGWYLLTPRAKSITTEADYKRYAHASRYPREAIHPLVEKNTISEFMSGDYDTAVFKAFKTLEDLVRKRATLGNEMIGVPLMRAAFHPKTGPLTDKTEHEAEREALMHLMAGAIGRFKNPTSHRFTGLDDPIATIEILQLASSLVRIAEQRQRKEVADPRGPETAADGKEQ
jgi:uncharacterized protein (TIGR02391 family)